MPQLKGQPGSSGMNPPGGVSTINLSNWSDPSPPPRRHMNPPPLDVDNQSRSFNAANDDSRPSAGLCESNNDRSIARNYQAPPFGQQTQAEENEAALKRRPGYDEKRKEMYGSGIFGESGGPVDPVDAGYGGFYAEKAPVGEIQQSRGRIQSDAKHKELFGSKPHDFQEPRCRPTSDAKAKELNGSNIFGYQNYEYHPPSAHGRSIQSPPEDQRFPRRGWTNNNYNNNSPRGGGSQGSQGSQYGSDHDPLESPKRPGSNSEAAKQREMSSNEINNDVTGSGRLNFSSAKARELAGDNIFGPPPSETGKMSAHMREPAGKKSQLISNNQFEENPDPFDQRKHEMKSAELSGNNIFHSGSNPGDDFQPHHHQRSVTKVKEICGSDIFSNEKPRARNTVGGIRKPPGGGSSIMLS